MKFARWIRAPAARDLDEVVPAREGAELFVLSRIPGMNSPLGLYGREATKHEGGASSGE